MADQINKNNDIKKKQKNVFNNYVFRVSLQICNCGESPKLTIWNSY